MRVLRWDTFCAKLDKLAAVVENVRSNVLEMTTLDDDILWPKVPDCSGRLFHVCEGFDLAA